MGKGKKKQRSLPPFWIALIAGGFTLAIVITVGLIRVDNNECIKVTVFGNEVERCKLDSATASLKAPPVESNSSLIDPQNKTKSFSDFKYLPAYDPGNEAEYYSFIPGVSDTIDGVWSIDGHSSNTRINGLIVFNETAHSVGNPFHSGKYSLSSNFEGYYYSDIGHYVFKDTRRSGGGITLVLTSANTGENTHFNVVILHNRAGIDYTREFTINSGNLFESYTLKEVFPSDE